MKGLLRYWHTLRYLRPVQIYGRAWYRLYRPRPRLGPAPKLRAVVGAWCRPARREPSLIDAETFVFLGQSGSLREVGWNGTQREKLWRYNQHYFDDLNAWESEARSDWHRTLLQNWVENNPPVEGDGWEPYPTSLRIVNWVKWALAGNTLPETCLHSLAVQARWLSERLETHLLGNHLFSNAKALVFAGLFFKGEEAEQWLHTGLGILTREIPEQILADGGHFERSTMYHALALEDMLDLINVLECYRGELLGADLERSTQWRVRVAQMLDWLNAMRHPDGEIGFFNDAAFGIAPSCNELIAYARRMALPILQEESVGSRWLSHSGYVRLETKAAVALLDLAPIGPDYLPGHAHADTLSFELSVDGQRLLVNSGTSCYGMGPERLRQRGTRAHNTVVIADEDSSEVWSGFRVARRARPLSPKLDLSGRSLSVACAHDGYTRLPGKPVHHRRWEMSESELIVEDQVSVNDLPAQAKFHFHPDVKLEPEDGATQGIAVLPNGQRITWAVHEGRAHLEPSTWHPRFGVSLPSLCLSVALVGGKSHVHWRW